MYSKRTPSKFHGKPTWQQTERLISQQMDTLLLSTFKSAGSNLTGVQSFSNAPNTQPNALRHA